MNPYAHITRAEVQAMDADQRLMMLNVLRNCNTWTKPMLLALRGWERPSLACTVAGRQTVCRISPDEPNKPYVETWFGGSWLCCEMDWETILEQLNADFPRPLTLDVVYDDTDQGASRLDWRNAVPQPTPSRR